MFKGVLILESLRVGTSLTGFRLTVSEVERERAELSTQQIAAGLPPIWFVIAFQVEDDRSGELASRLSRVLEPIGWYVNFSSQKETYIVYPGKVFHYPRGDPDRTTEAQAYGRTLGIPEPQLEWSE